MSSLIRLEIIANHSMRDEIIADLKAVECHNFTEIPIAYGEGRQDPKHGDGVWPENNFIIIIYNTKEVTDAIMESIQSLKEIYPKEGIKMFTMTSA
jgi:hypothetical protein